MSMFLPFQVGTRSRVHLHQATFDTDYCSKEYSITRNLLFRHSLCRRILFETVPNVRRFPRRRGPNYHTHHRPIVAQFWPSKTSSSFNRSMRLYICPQRICSCDGMSWGLQNVPPYVDMTWRRWRELLQRHISARIDMKATGTR